MSRRARFWTLARVTSAIWAVAAGVDCASARTTVSLTNPAGGAPWPGAATVSAPEDLLNDHFNYNPDVNYSAYATVPDGFLPDTRWNGGSTLFIANNTDATNWWGADVNLTSGQTLDYLDIWGRSDYAGAEQTRHQNLIINFYNAPGGSAGGGAVLGASAEYSGVTAKAANNALGSAFGRFDVSSVLNATLRAQVQSVEISHGPTSLNDFLLLTEIRASTGPLLPPFPTLTVNRDTGNVTLSNGRPEERNFIAYSILSNSGSLNEAAWQSVAATGDGNSGGSIDGDNWIEFTAPGSRSNLSEGELPGGDGLTLSMGESINFGNVWIKSAREDVTIQALKADNTFEGIQVEYVGNGGNPFAPGDLNFDGAVNPQDWPIFRTGLGSVFVGGPLSIAETYRQGDLDGDLDTDMNDFRQFETLYDAANGSGALAQLVAAVPEPSSVLLVGIAGVALFASRRRVTLMAAAGICMVSLTIDLAQAQTFTIIAPPANPATDVTADNVFSAAFAPGNLFTDTALTAADLNTKVYTNASAQYAGRGNGPMHLFIDNGQTISTNWIAFAQRNGDIASADRVGKLEFWFSNSNFGGIIPQTAPDATVNFEDPFGSTLKPYALLDDVSGRYVAMRMTIHPVSAAGAFSNVGGHELRFMQGFSPLVLQVNTATGAMTLKNTGALAQSLTLDSYQISSEAGSLSAGWSGLGGQPGFPEGNGTGNGWEAGGGSNAKLLSEAYLLDGSSVNVGASLSLGSGYNTAVNAQDLKFSYSLDNSFTAEGIIEYISSGLPADFNVDGAVDGADFLQWQRGFGISSGATKAQGDADGNGAVNGADLVLWKSSFGASATAAASQIPEPATLTLAVAAGALVALARRRR